MRGGVLTVDSDSNRLGEDEAVGALKGRDLAELVELQVVGRDALGRLRVDELDVEAVLLCDSQERRGARVTLLVGCQLSFAPQSLARVRRQTNLRRSCRSFRKT